MAFEHLGIDLAFDNEGDLVVSATGDITTFTGRDCLLHDLADALRTQPGDLFPHPEYGCAVMTMLGANDSPLNRALTQKYIEQTIERNARVIASTIRVEALSFDSEVKSFRATFQAVGDSDTHTLVWGYGIKSIDDLKRNTVTV